MSSSFAAGRAFTAAVLVRFILLVQYIARASTYRDVTGSTGWGDRTLGDSRYVWGHKAALYREMLAEDRHDHPEAFEYVTAQLFHGISLAGLRVLEIGSGTGLQSIYMAQRGAHVISLEPEGVGATAGVIAKQRDRCRRLGLETVEVINADFNEWQSDGKFDLILSKNSINHLYPSEHHALSHVPTQEGYVRVLRRIHDLLAPDGVFIATDACRYGLFSLTRRWLRRPWAPRRTGVNWRHHQNPGTWRHLLRAAGFSDVSVAYPVPYALRRLATIVNTAPANFFLKGSFILRARP